jgi:hypothetical protein
MPQTHGMRSLTQEQSRAERLRAHAAAVEEARRVAAAMATLVRGRESRARDGGPPLEVEFADLEVDGRRLPAAVWVALRRDDVDAAIEAMTTASMTEFLIEEREEMGDGYRLQSVAETLPLPESELLLALLDSALNIPADVLAVLAEWGPDDPRSAPEIEGLLSSRFGPANRPGVDLTQPRVEVDADVDLDGRLTVTVGELAEVLRLDEEQLRALTVLVRNATVTLTMR